MELNENIARRFVADTVGTKDTLTGVSKANPEAESNLPEVQNAIRAAMESTESAIGVARLINRLLKKSQGKANNGPWVPAAVDSLRSGLLFASAGLDTSLKRLVRHALPTLAVRDEKVDMVFQRWATNRVSDPGGAVQAEELIRILLASGVSPRDSLMQSWVYDLTSGSAQSADRVDELAKAFGITDQALRKRVKPAGTPTKLQLAFRARNQITHELDVTDPEAETRQPLEKIRRYRSEANVAEWCRELLDVTQVIVNNVASRIASLRLALWLVFLQSCEHEPQPLRRG
jgi:hypothetical protein